MAPPAITTPYSLNDQNWSGWTEALKSAAIAGSGFALSAAATRVVPTLIGRIAWGGAAGAVPLLVSDISKLITCHNTPCQEQQLTKEFVCHLGELAGGVLLGVATGGANVAVGYLINAAFSGLAEYARASWLTALPEENKVEHAVWATALNLGISIALHSAGSRIAEAIEWRNDHLEFKSMSLPQAPLARNMGTIPRAQAVYRQLETQAPKLKTVYDWLRLANQSYKKGTRLKTAILFDELTLRLEQGGHDALAAQTRRYFHDCADRWLSSKSFEFGDTYAADMLYLFTRRRCNPMTLEKPFCIGEKSRVGSPTVKGIFFDPNQEGRLPLGIKMGSDCGHVDFYLHRNPETGQILGNLHDIKLEEIAPRGAGQKFLRDVGQALQLELNVGELLLTSIGQTGRYVWPKMGVRPVSAEDCERLELTKFIPSVLESPSPDEVHAVYRTLFTRELQTAPARYGLEPSNATSFLRGNETAMELASLSLNGHNPIRDALRSRPEKDINQLFLELHKRGTYDGIISVQELLR